MSCCQCVGIEQEFDPEYARKELERYRRKGMRKTTRWLVDALRSEGIEGTTLLDVGGGIGAIPLELLNKGARFATGVDASSAFLYAARQEADRQGVSERVDYLHGDFVEVSDDVDPADIVTLDRVVCCYDDMPALIGASTAHARQFFALVYPKDTWWTQVGGAAINLWLQLRPSDMRVFIHPAEEIDALVRRRGFKHHTHRTTLVWRVDVYRRPRRGGHPPETL